MKSLKALTPLQIFYQNHTNRQVGNEQSLTIKNNTHTVFSDCFLARSTTSFILRMKTSLPHPVFVKYYQLSYKEDGEKLKSDKSLFKYSNFKFFACPPLICTAGRTESLLYLSHRLAYRLTATHQGSNSFVAVLITAWIYNTHQPPSFIL